MPASKFLSAVRVLGSQGQTSVSISARLSASISASTLGEWARTRVALCSGRRTWTGIRVVPWIGMGKGVYVLAAVKLLRTRAVVGRVEGEGAAGRDEDLVAGAADFDEGWGCGA